MYFMVEVASVAYNQLEGVAVSRVLLLYITDMISSFRLILVTTLLPTTQPENAVFDKVHSLSNKSFDAWLIDTVVGLKLTLI